MQDLTVALAVPADLDALPAIERAAARLFPPEDVPPAVAGSTVPRATLERACAAGRLWVARLGCRVVGFLVATLLDGAPFVVELDVLPELQRRGIGKALLRVAMAWAAAEPARALTLTPFRHLPFNAPLYGRLGFAEIPAAEQGPELRAQLAGEARNGLDPARRVAMRLRLAPVPPGASPGA